MNRTTIRFNQDLSWLTRTVTATMGRSFRRMAVTMAALLCLLSGAWAEDITAEQALQLAQAFMTNHKSTKGATVVPQLMPATKVSGLYVFNIKGNGGFVIVSNDDRTMPILGFGDSGAIDPDNIPDNMRAWLQGYADEIAWAKKHKIKKLDFAKSKNGKPRKIGIHSTDSIEPLIVTTWYQNSPYNNLCPTYYGGTCVTGCVATAMAQVMKYHEWPQGPTTSIPSYECNSSYLQQTMSALPPTTFDWANMKNNYGYGSNYTSAQAQAVATLMKYCGWSVKMQYGPSSGAYSEDIADALINYFDYNASTTQYIVRSAFGYANWTDIIYHELENSRPVLYGGQSSGGGHEFVCDGYMYDSESGTDFFHINWGWGGTSDHYFVLSALDPDQQGIGGSTSDDGFHYGQDAVVGIQPSTGTGTTADINPRTNDLTLNNITADHTIVGVGSEVNITFNITNNSADEYDGDIWLVAWKSNSYYEDYIVNSMNFVIPAGTTMDCVVPFTPDEEGDYTVEFYYMASDGQLVPSNLTITINAYDAPTNSYVPIHGLWVDDYSRSQFIIPAANLDEMAGAIVNGVTFRSSTKNVDWGAAEFDVYLSEVDGTTISSLKDWNMLTKVYSGSLSISQNKMEIVFDEPYEYTGGNLLVGINQTVSGSYKSCSWYGTEATGASLGGHGTEIAQQNFLPETTFDYEIMSNVEAPTELTATEITATTATLTWTGGTGLYNVEFKKTADSDWTSALTNTELQTYTLTDLTENTAYQARVQSVEVSNWKNVRFTTPYSCPAPTELTCTAYTTTTATLTWTENGTATQWEVCVDGNLGNLIVVTESPTCTLTGLTSEMVHTAKVRAVNSEDDKSLWTETISFETTDKWVVGSGTDTNGYLPLNSYYNYSLTQQIYTTAELGEGGILKCIDYYSTATNRTRNIDIYMISTNKSCFDSKTDWFTVCANDLVFSGSVTFKENEWTTIVLDNYFEYDGLSNVAIIIDDNTGSYLSNGNFKVFSALNQALYIYNDNTNYDPFSPPTSGTILHVKNQIRLVKDELPPIIRPTSLSVNYTGGTTATVSWNSNMTAFDLEVNGTVIEDVTNPYILTELEYGTTYNVRVRARENEIMSDWTSMVSFETDLCDQEDMCVISMNLTDSYGDGWNGCAIKVVDVLTGKEIGSATISNGSSETVLLSVPHDRDIKFTWVAGNYGYECSWTVKDNNGVVLFSGTGNSNMANGTVLYTHHVDCNDPQENPAPTDLAADLEADGATLTWTANGDSYNVQYRTIGGEWLDVTPAPTEATATLSGLATNNGYEYRIKSMKGNFSSGWSESGVFALLTLEDAEDNTNLIASNNGRQAHVTLAGRSIYKDGDWNTLYLPFALSAEQIVASALEGADIRSLNDATLNNTKLSLKFSRQGELDNITAGTPYIIRWAKDDNYVDDNEHNIWQPAFKNVIIDQTVNNKECNLGDGKAIAFKGTYEYLAFTEATPSILFLGLNNTLYYPLKDAYVGTHRAFFELTGFTADEPSGNGVRSFVLNFGDDINGTTTHINEELGVKGKELDNTLYDLQGRRVDNSKFSIHSSQYNKGVYIQNGKKVVIK